MATRVPVVVIILASCEAISLWVGLDLEHHTAVQTVNCTCFGNPFGLCVSDVISRQKAVQPIMGWHLRPLVVVVVVVVGWPFCGGVWQKDWKCGEWEQKGCDCRCGHFVWVKKKGIFSRIWNFARWRFAVTPCVNIAWWFSENNRWMTTQRFDKYGLVVFSRKSKHDWQRPWKYTTLLSVTLPT